MPELPEVETVLRELKPLIKFKSIKEVEALWARSVVLDPMLNVENQTIRNLWRKGKYLILNLDDGSLIIHLRMTGRLLFDPGPVAELPKHTRAIVYFNDHSVLFFRDSRKFGRIYHVPDPNQFLNHVGIDALDPDFNESIFSKMCRSRKMGIKAFLLSQRDVAGMGNIYVDESLFRAQIHPLTKTDQLTTAQAKKLFGIMREVLDFSIEHMGSTISDYRDAYGNPGTNQDFFRVYGRVNEPCFTCESEIVKIKVAGRGTHICPQCQLTGS